MFRSVRWYFTFTILLISPVLAHAIEVETSVGTFEVSVLPASAFNDLSDQLDDQPWWGDAALAQEFAFLVGNSFSPQIPIFAHGVQGGFVEACFLAPGGSVPVCANDVSAFSTFFTYAIAVEVVQLPVVVASSVGTFEIELLPPGSFNSLSDVLDDQPWWDDIGLAEEFAMLVGAEFGVQNASSLGPYFAIGAPSSVAGCFVNIFPSGFSTICSNNIVSPATTTVIYPIALTPDSDGDGSRDDVDNCIEVANPSQSDTDGDGIGNRCDADIASPNDCVVNAVDLGLFKLAFFGVPGDSNWNPDSDFDGDDVTNAVDLGILKSFFFEEPGPSALPNACDPAPSVPQNVTGNATGPFTTTLSWNASVDAGGSDLAGYRVYRDGVLVGQTAATNFADSGLSPNTTYAYTVSAYDFSNNESAQSMVVSIMTDPPDMTPPTVPSNLVGNPDSSTRVIITWDSSVDLGGAGLEGYRVYRDGNLVEETESTSFEDRDLSPDTTYSYSVSAIDIVANESAQSLAVDVTTGPEEGVFDTSVGTFRVLLLPRASFNSQAGLLSSQLWWGNPGLAEEFVEVVGSYFGQVNANSFGPYFATQVGSSVGGCWANVGSTGFNALCSTNLTSPNTASVYVVAEPATR